MSNSVQESLLISAIAFMLVQSGGAVGKRMYATMDAQQAGLSGFPWDPDFITPWMRAVLSISVLIDTAAAVSIVAWFVVRGPYSWWWLLPSMFVGSGIAGAFILGPVSRRMGAWYVMFCTGSFTLAAVTLWLWY